MPTNPPLDETTSAAPPETLAAIDPSQAEGVLREALSTPRPPQLRAEYEETLRRLRG